MFRSRCSQYLGQALRKVFTSFLIPLFVFTAAPISAEAAIADLSWNRNSESNIVNYRIYYGTNPGVLSSTVNVGNNTTLSIAELSQGLTYYFAVSAVNNLGLESALSSMVVLVVPNSSNPGNNPNPPTPNNPGTPPSWLLQSCGSPYSAASGIESELISFNPGNTSAEANHLLRQSSGAPLAAFDSSMQIGGILKSGLGALSLNSTQRRAQLCSESNHHTDGELLFSRLGFINSIIRKKRVARTQLGAQFKFALAVNGGLTGRQVIQFNSHHPGKGSETNNPVRNDLVIENLSDSLGDGTLYVFDSAGALMAQQRISVPVQGNYEFGLYNLGRNIGLAFWTPDNSSQRFNVSNRVFILDNNRGLESYTTAYAITAANQGGSRVMVPINLDKEKSKIMVSNTLGQNIAATIEFFDGEGKLRRREQIIIGARGILLRDPTVAFKKTRQLKAATRGFMIVTSSAINSIAVANLQTAKLPDSKLAYAYTMPGKVAAGADLSGYFNVWNGDKALLWLMNSSSADQNVTISLLFPDGSYQPVFAGRLKANGGQYLDFANFAGAYGQGVFAVQVENPNAVAAIALRGQPGRYFYASEVRE